MGKKEGDLRDLMERLFKTMNTVEWEVSTLRNAMEDVWNNHVKQSDDDIPPSEMWKK